MKNPINFEGLKEEPIDLIEPPATSAPSRPVVPVGQGTSLSDAPQAEQAPAREPVFETRDLQISIKGDARVIQRFKDLCERERWPYWKMLEILMNERSKG